MKKMFEAWREERDKAREGDGSRRGQGPPIVAVVPHIQCLPTASCRSVPTASHPARSCATVCSHTPPSPAYARPRASELRTAGCRRNAPTPPRAPPPPLHPPPTRPWPSSSWSRRGGRWRMEVDASSVRKRKRKGKRVLWEVCGGGRK